MMIRHYLEPDAPRLAAIHNQVYPQHTYTVDGFRDYMADVLATGGQVWVVAGSQLSGYAVLSPVPALTGVADLSGCIVPERQRLGLGSALLQVVLRALQGSDIRQITHCVSDMDSPAARFLRKHDFFVEHEEWLLSLDDLRILPEVGKQQSVRLQTFEQKVAVDLFCRLYRESFCGLPWDQPFTPEEVMDTLVAATDLLFLMRHGEPIGFAWVYLDAKDQALIEPLGIIPPYQRQGCGRVLLLSALRELRRRGARRVQIGAWRSNKAAIQLYQSVGFRHQETMAYLAYNLQDRPA